jgi:hypothetical protein
VPRAVRVSRWGGRRGEIRKMVSQPVFAKLWANKGHHVRPTLTPPPPPPSFPSSAHRHFSTIPRFSPPLSAKRRLPEAPEAPARLEAQPQPVTCVTRVTRARHRPRRHHR